MMKINLLTELIQNSDALPLLLVGVTLMFLAVGVMDVSSNPCGIVIEVDPLGIVAVPSVRLASVRVAIVY